MYSIVYMKTLTLTEARNRLLNLADELEKDPSSVVEVSRRGKRVMALISAELYDSLVETLEVLSDRRTTSRLRKALRELDQGKGIPWGRARRELGLGE
jgi:prevent-host-death family protein